MTVQPLLTGTDTAQALERLAATAKSELLMCLPRLGAETPLVIPELRSRGLDTWGDLLGVLSQRGVDLRLLFADVDPVVRSDSHRAIWRHASAMADVLEGGAQLLCAPHGHCTTAYTRHAKPALAALRAEDPQRLTPVQRALVSQDAGVRPAEIGQAFALADGRACVLGGPDLGTRSETDLALSIGDTDFCGALRCHFADSWAAAIATGAKSLNAVATPVAYARRPQSRDDLRLLRSFARPGTGSDPHTLSDDHDPALSRLFDRAERTVLLRTPALRHPGLIRSLTEAAARTPDLQLILLLPATPHPDPWDTDKAQALQNAALTQLRSAFGPRLACVAGPASAARATLCLVDDAVAVLGSASLTLRAFRWNTEVSALIRDGDLSRRLLDHLGALILGPDTPTDDLRQARTWQRGAPAFENGATSRPTSNALPDSFF